MSFLIPTLDGVDACVEVYCSFRTPLSKQNARRIVAVHAVEYLYKLSQIDENLKPIPLAIDINLISTLCGNCASVPSLLLEKSGTPEVTIPAVASTPEIIDCNPTVVPKLLSCEWHQATPDFYVATAFRISINNLMLPWTVVVPYQSNSSISPVEFTCGEGTVCFSEACSITLPLTRFFEAKAFDQHLFEILYPQKFRLSWIPKCNKKLYLLLPLSNSNSGIDWELVTTVCETILQKRLPLPTPPENLLDPDRVLITAYSDVLYVAHNLSAETPLSPFPDRKYSNFSSYFREHHNIVVRPDQHLLQCSILSHSRTTEVDINSKVFLVPELCRFHPMRLSTILAAMKLPCILAKLEAICFLAGYTHYFRECC